MPENTPGVKPHTAQLGAMTPDMVVTLTGEVAQPSVWIESGTGGELRYGVKLYGKDPKELLKEARALFTELVKYAEDTRARKAGRG